jgi:uncharacterized protein YyaL (SSP411 family)
VTACARLIASFLAVFWCYSALGATERTTPIAWKTQWNQALFAEAAREHRFVLLDLHAVWCHWCHVMDQQTYANPSVMTLIGKHYIAVSVDADSDPALASRYGNWGWPATIVLAADGTEIVKRRGFIAPAQMTSLLQAIILDPSPGPSVEAAAPRAASGKVVLSTAQRAALKKTYVDAYDVKYGGWGAGQKFIDAPTLEYTLALDLEERDKAAGARARQTLEANLKLIDHVWGGVFQYSATPDWESPHYEKLLSFQANDLRVYSEAYARWHDRRYLEAAYAIQCYIATFLTSRSGAFYVSQDADLSEGMPGPEYYALSDAMRRKSGIPWVDSHTYARENGWAIGALCRLYDVSGNPEALSSARRAALWVLEERSLQGGGFRHDDRDNGGPYLEDTLSMGQAFLALYRSTGERDWLVRARAAMEFIAMQFRDSRGGFMSAPVAVGSTGVFSNAPRSIEENVAVGRFANLLNRYTADVRYRQFALHAVRYANSAADADQLHADVLLADRELSEAPIHITIVGGKKDAAAQALHAAALAFPATYLQVDWWDKDEGPLPNPEITYPQLQHAAAFACTGSSCSTPVFDAEAVSRTVFAALNR